MLVPTINIVSGRAVQLAGSDVPRHDAGDPTPIARRFGYAPEATLVDVDAVMERGNNTALIESLLPLGCFRVGGAFAVMPKPVAGWIWGPIRSSSAPLPPQNSSKTPERKGDGLF